MDDQQSRKNWLLIPQPKLLEPKVFSMTINNKEVFIGANSTKGLIWKSNQDRVSIVVNVKP